MNSVEVWQPGSHWLVRIGCLATLHTSLYTPHLGALGAKIVKSALKYNLWINVLISFFMKCMMDSLMKKKFVL
ncbi:hypothetical protein D3C86_1743550 [compost metagenome]